MILKNSRVRIELSVLGEYDGPRFDHLPSVKQITLDDEHTFLGIERTKAGVGSRGFGLQCGFLWSDESFARSMEAVEQVYPLLGVGRLRLPPGQNYHIHEQYETFSPEISIVDYTDTRLETVSIDMDIAEIRRSIELEGQTLSLVCNVTNLSNSSYSFDEYCHNFFQFDDHLIDSEYRCDISYPASYELVRGTIEASKGWYRPQSFDDGIGTLAVIPHAKEQTKTTSVTVSHQRSSTFITATDDFGPRKTYHWVSPWSLCPENYFQCTLVPGQAVRFVRQFEVGYTSL